MVEARLLEAFERSLTENGWHDTTLVRIAELAQSSRMTLHRKGITKDSLLAVLAERLAGEHRDALWAAVTGAGSGMQRLELALTAECALTEKHLGLLAALDAAEHAVLYHDNSRSGSRSSYIAPYERILSDGVADGTVRTLPDVTDTATIVFNSVGLTYRHLRTGHRWSITRASAIIESTLLSLRP